MYTNFGLDQDQFTTLDNNWTLPIHNGRALMMCGYCNNPAAYHTDTYVEDESLNVCEYDFSSDGPRVSYDYFLHSANGAVTVYENYANNSEDQYTGFKYGIDYDNQDGTVTNFRLEDDPTYYVSPWDTEYASIDNWSDKNSNEFTHALDWYYVTPDNIMSGTYDEDHPKRAKATPFNFNADRTAYVEGTEGFIARQYIDLNTTEKYHMRLLNSFINKRSGKFHVGSIAFDFVGSTVIATCVNRGCEKLCDDGQYRQAAYVLDRSLVTDVAMMEAFVYSVIKHGNNHGPDFITSRVTMYKHKTYLNQWIDGMSNTTTEVVHDEFVSADWYLMHDFGCDLNHDGMNCNNDRVVTDVLVTELNDVEFVMEHQRFCVDSNCECDEWLANEVPVLARSAA